MWYKQESIFHNLVLISLKIAWTSLSITFANTEEGNLTGYTEGYSVSKSS